MTLLPLALLLLVVTSTSGALVSRAFGIEHRSWWLDASLGLAALGTAFTYLLLAGAFRPAPLLILTVIATVGGALVGGPGVVPRLRRPTGVALVSAVVGLAIVVLALYPYQGSDFRTYQYPMALGYAGTGTWTWFADLRFPTFPPLMNLWFAVSSMAGGEWGVVLAQLAALLPLFLLCALLAHWSPQLGEGPPIYAVALLVGSPATIWAATYAFVDTAMTLFGVLSVYCLHRFHQAGGWRGRPPSWRWPALAGVLAGAAMNVKYLGIFFVAFGAAWLLLSRLLERDPAAPCGARGRWRADVTVLGAFAATSLAVAAPWLVRTWWETGNPFFPFGEVLLGENHYGWSYRPGPPQGRLREVLLRSPLRWDGVNPWLLPLALAVVLRLARGLRRGLRQRLYSPTLLVDAAAVSHLAFFLLLPGDRRYALPTLAFFSVAGGPLVAGALQRLLRSASPGKARGFLRLLHPVWVACLLAGLGLAFLSHQLTERPVPPPGTAQHESFLRETVPALDALRWAQENLPADTVYSVDAPDLAPFARDVRFIGGEAGPRRSSRLFDGVVSSDDIRARLAELGVDVLIEAHCGESLPRALRRSRRHTLLRSRRDGGDPPSATPPPRILAAGLEPVHRSGGACVYRIAAD